MNLILVRKQQEGPDTTSFFFKSDPPFMWNAGQFLHYTLPHANPDERKTERYFTISSAPHEGDIRLTTRFAGEKGSSFKKALQALPVGGSIQAEGPEGDFTVDDPAQECVFIAGGIGITPYRSMLSDLDHRGLPIHVTLLYANRTEDAVFKEELEALSKKHPTFKIHYFIGDARIDEAAIKKIVPDLQKPIFYVSGPEPMVQAFEKTLPDMGIREDHVKRDYFPGYDWP